MTSCQSYVLVTRGLFRFSAILNVREPLKLEKHLNLTQWSRESSGVRIFLPINASQARRDGQRISFHWHVVRFVAAESASIGSVLELVKEVGFSHAAAVQNLHRFKP